MYKLMIAFIVVLSASGCSRTYTMQEARSFSDDRVAILVNDTPVMDPYVYITSIDGVRRGFGDFKAFRLVPGERHVMLRGNSQSGFYAEPKVVVFEAEAGRRYEVVLSERGLRPYWMAGIIDSTTGKRVDIKVYSPQCEMRPWYGLRCTIEHKE